MKSCPDSQFRCSNGIQCIERRYRCDERTDCNDGSDEDNCRKFYHYIKEVVFIIILHILVNKPQCCKCERQTENTVLGEENEELLKIGRKCLDCLNNF